MIDLSNIDKDTIIIKLLPQQRLCVLGTCAHLEGTGLDDEIAHTQARIGTRQHLLLHRAWSHEPNDERLFRLPYPVDSRLGLYAHTPDKDTHSARLTLHSRGRAQGTGHAP